MNHDNYECCSPRYKRRGLSASVDGRGIKVSANASPGTLIHTALVSPAANEWDEVWLKAVNISGAGVLLTVQWGGTTSPDDHIAITIPPQAGLTEVIPGHLLHNGLEVRAFAGTADVIVIHGFVNRFEQVQ